MTPVEILELLEKVVDVDEFDVALGPGSSVRLTLTGPYLAEPGVEIVLAVHTPAEPPGVTALTYAWDFDADGTVDEVTTEPSVRHTYELPYDGRVEVAAEYADDVSGSGSAPVVVDEDIHDLLSVEPPSNVVAVAGPNDATVTVRWGHPPSELRGYTILDQDGNPVVHVGPDTNDFTVTHLRVGETVSFSVEAIGQFAASAPAASNAVTVPGTL